MNRMIPQPGTFTGILKINYIRSLQWPLIQKQERKWWSIQALWGLPGVCKTVEMFIALFLAQTGKISGCGAGILFWSRRDFQDR